MTCRLEHDQVSGSISLKVNISILDVIVATFHAFFIIPCNRSSHSERFGLLVESAKFIQGELWVNSNYEYMA